MYTPFAVVSRDLVHLSAGTSIAVGPEELIEIASEHRSSVSREVTLFARERISFSSKQAHLEQIFSNISSFIATENETTL